MNSTIRIKWSTLRNHIGNFNLINSLSRRTKAVFGCGFARSGSLFIRVPADRIPRPRQAVFFNQKQVKHVAAGLGFSICASNDCVYGAGINIFDNSASNLRNLIWIKHVNKNIFKIPIKDGVKSISAGRRHFLVATDQDEIYSFGDNSHGQCGFDPSSSSYLFPNKADITNNCALRLPSSSKISKVHCCFDTSFVLMESGEMFSFGLGIDGQLGRGLALSDWRCLKVGGDELNDQKFVSIEGSGDTLLTVTDSGKLFMWGMNEHGQMHPFSQESQVSEPLEIRFNVGKIIQAVSTCTSCMLLTSDGQVYVWGYGILGLGPEVLNSARPFLIDSQVFSCRMQDDGRVKKIFAGASSTFAITRRNNLFSWGCNTFSQLGLSHENDQFFPFQVCVPCDPLSVSAAPDHTLILTR